MLFGEYLTRKEHGLKNISNRIGSVLYAAIPIPKYKMVYDYFNRYNLSFYIDLKQRIQMFEINIKNLMLYTKQIIYTLIYTSYYFTLKILCFSELAPINF